MSPIAELECPRSLSTKIDQKWVYKTLIKSVPFLIIKGRNDEEKCVIMIAVSTSQFLCYVFALRPLQNLVHALLSIPGPRIILKFNLYFG